MKIHLNIQDKNRNKDTGEYERNDVPIDRKLNRTEGLLLAPGGPTKEHNILLYVANLKAKVTGYVEYQKVGAEKPQMNAKMNRLNVKEFYLDLHKGQSIIKNHIFLEFWNSVSEIEELIRTDNNLTI